VRLGRANPEQRTWTGVPLLAVFTPLARFGLASRSRRRSALRGGRVLATEPVRAQTTADLRGGGIVTRSLRLLPADPRGSSGDGKRPDESVWAHAKTFLSVESVTTRDGQVIASDQRMHVCSLEPARLSAKQWLLLVRRHWAVENNCHHTLDSAFAEDDRPWIEADPQGMLAVLFLRRVALTLLALFRAVTLRSKKRRATPWRTLLRALRDALVAATETQLAGLRLRDLPAATL
jgi:hypothetical protein